MFQSAPGIKAGGNLFIALGLIALVLFQSAPGIKAGGNDLQLPTVDMHGVSIRPRHQGGGKPKLQPKLRAWIGGFNPPPASRPGETRRSRLDTTRGRRFQSAPGIKAGGNGTHTNTANG